MNERVMQFRVGVTVIATLLISGILVLLFDGLPTIGVQPYVIYLRFTQAPGVTDGTPIRKSGIRIGRVRRLQFAEDFGGEIAREGGVVVTAEIDAPRTIYTRERPQIGKSLLGDAFIEFIRDPSGELGPALEPGVTIVGTVVADPLQFIGNIEGSLSTAITSVARTSEEIGSLSRRINDLLISNDEQLVRIVTKAEQSLDGIQQAVNSANGLLGDPKLQQDIKDVATRLPKVLKELDESIVSLKPAMQRADAILADIQQVSKPLGERGPALIETIDHASQKLDQALGDLSNLTRSITSSEGTLGRLLKDPSLYDEVHGLAQNVTELTRELKPIVRDVRSFTDKVARHPETLGVRGAIFPSSGIK